MHINDWQSIQTLWEKLGRALERAVKATGALGTPRVYVKMLAELEDFLNKTLAGALVGLVGLWVCFGCGFGRRKSLVSAAPNFRAPPRRRVGVLGCLRTRVPLGLSLRVLCAPKKRKTNRCRQDSNLRGLPQSIC